jgi:hypothetical protein
VVLALPLKKSISTAFFGRLSAFSQRLMPPFHPSTNQTDDPIAPDPQTSPKTGLLMQHWG